MRLGDFVEFVAKWTGIKAFVKRFIPDCGCERRKEKLNQFTFTPANFPPNTSKRNRGDGQL